MSCIFWGVMAPDVLETQRAGMDLGLRSALLYYSDLSIPGMSSVSFIRQVTWPCLAIALKERHDLRGLSVARLATAIEALGCKLWLDKNEDHGADARGGRIGGVRTLPGRNCSFVDLGPPQGYVSNPKRRVATRALPEQGGLGFTKGGQRLDRMVLTPQGENLVKDVLETRIYSRQTLADWLVDWTRGEEKMGAAVKERALAALSPFFPLPSERLAIKAALYRDTDEGRRGRLIELLNSRGEAPLTNVEHDLFQHLPSWQAEEIRIAWAFRRLLTAAQQTLRKAASALETTATRLPLATVAHDTAGEELKDLCAQARKFQKLIAARPSLGHSAAVIFAQDLLDGSHEQTLTHLVGRADRLIQNDGGILRRGAAFSEALLLGRRNIEDTDEIEEDSGLPPRFYELISLLADCAAEGTRE